MGARCRGRWAGLLLTAVAGCGSRAVPEPVWVGHLAPLSGPNRTAGEHARQGVQLAVAEARAEGQTVAGRPIAVVHVDDRGDADLSQSETVRLLTVNKVAALLAGPGAGLAERLVRADQPYGVPVVVPGELADPGPGVLVLGARPEARGRALARYAARDLKGRRAVVLTDARDPAAGALAAAFVKEWPRGQPVEEWSVGGAEDLPALAGRVAKAKADVVVFAGTAADFRTLRAPLADTGLRAVLIFGGEDGGVAPLQGGLETGPQVLLATVYLPEKLTARGQDFARRYEADFHEPPDLYAAQAYDGARLLLDILQRAQTTAPATLRDELARTATFETVTGPVSWKDQRPRRAFFLVELKEGHPRLVQTVEANHE